MDADFDNLETNNKDDYDESHLSYDQLSQTSSLITVIFCTGTRVF